MKDGTVNSVKNKLAQYVQYMKLSKLVQWLMVERVGEFKVCVNKINTQIQWVIKI